MRTINNQPHVRRYRLKQQARYDYYASPDVAAIIAHYQAKSSERCVAGILDGLIRAAHRALSGKKT